MKNKTKIRLVEFFIIGVLFGVAEDLIAISLATEGAFHWHYVFIAIIVAIPFAILSEIIVDHPGFWKDKLPKKWFTNIENSDQNQESKNDIA